MDLYGSLDPSLASSSGASTPIRTTAGEGDESTSTHGRSPSASPPSSSGHAGASSKSAGKPTIEQEIEQMGTLVSGMSKNLGSYWSSFRRQVSFHYRLAWSMSLLEREDALQARRLVEQRHHAGTFTLSGLTGCSLQNPQSETVLKQSQALASNAAKDLTPYLDKAKAELAHLNEQAKASAAAGQAASISELGVNLDNPSVVIPAPREDKGKGVDREGDASADPTSPAGSVKTLVPESTEDGNKPAMTAGAFFSKLQHQLSSNPKFQDFQHSFQNMQHDLKNKVVDFNKIDIHEARETYEKAMNSGEKYWKVASKELSDLFGEAVRIVPPEGYAGEGGQASRSGAAGKAADKRKKDAAVAAAGRKEMLLHRIRSEPAILLVDPAEVPAAVESGTAQSAAEEKKETHADTREAFATFLSAVQEAGGVDSEGWKAKIKAELEDDEGGVVLKQSYDSIGECLCILWFLTDDELIFAPLSAKQDPRGSILDKILLPQATD